MHYLRSKEKTIGCKLLVPVAVNISKGSMLLTQLFVTKGERRGAHYVMGVREVHPLHMRAVASHKLRPFNISSIKVALNLIGSDHSPMLTKLASGRREDTPTPIGE